MEGNASGTAILVVGSANVDLVAEVPSLPRPGETVLGTRLTVPGGKGANQAVAAARAGGAVTLDCAVGAAPAAGE